MTLADIAAMEKPLIGSREIAAVTGCDRYAINIMAKEGKLIFGCRAFFTGKKQTRVKISRLEFLRSMGYYGNINHTNSQ